MSDPVFIASAQAGLSHDCKRRLAMLSHPDRLRRPIRLAGMLTAALALTACSEAPKDTHPEQLVSKRQAVFKQFTRTLEPMGLVARDREPYQPDALLAQALELQRLASQPWPFFSPDGNYPPTKALAKVWDEPAAFEQAQRRYIARVDALVEAAKGRDIAIIRPAVSEVERACKACHDSFRRP
jgi:cytochrome c556